MLKASGFILTVFGVFGLFAAARAFTQPDALLFDIPAWLNVLSAALMLAFGVFGLARSGNRRQAARFISFGMILVNLEIVLLVLTLIELTYQRPLYSMLNSLIYGSVYHYGDDVSSYFYSALIGFGVSCAAPALYIVGGSRLRRAYYHKTYGGRQS
jgi:hypothetical protein